MVEIDTLFRSQSEDAFGRPSRTVWKVIAISGGAGRYDHASLADAADPLSTKMVAVSALFDPDLYRQVE
jgi:hypothetical protein